MRVVRPGYQIADDRPLEKVERCVGVLLWHCGNVGGRAGPRSKSGDWNHGHEVYMILDHLLVADGRAAADRWRSRRKSQLISLAHQI